MMFGRPWWHWPLVLALSTGLDQLMISQNFTLVYRLIFLFMLGLAWHWVFPPEH